VPAIPVFDHEAVLEAVAPLDAIDRVRQAFVEYANGEWVMPPHGSFTRIIWTSAWRWP